jgi:hypothetical protein
MANKAVKQASAGYQHSALVTYIGELYCWGDNRGICCGVAPQAKFIEHPTLVNCLYRAMENLALRSAISQSSTEGNKVAERAIDGNTDGDGAHLCSSTRISYQPYVDLDIGEYSLICKIVLWNRTDIPKDTKYYDEDHFTSRLFPCWIFIGDEPFDTSENCTLEHDILHSVTKIKFKNNQRVSEFPCPAHTIGRYVRVRLEGYNYLHIAQLEVFGYRGYSATMGQVSYVCCGKEVTVAVVRSKTDSKSFAISYQRAVYADAANAKILRQYDVYHEHYDKYKTLEKPQKCLICHGPFTCEICVLNSMYNKEISEMPKRSEMEGRYTLAEIEHYLLNISKPELKYEHVKRHERISRWEELKLDIRYNLDFSNWFKPRRVRYDATKRIEINYKPREPPQVVEYPHDFSLNAELAVQLGAKKMKDDESIVAESLADSIGHSKLSMDETNPGTSDIINNSSQSQSHQSHNNISISSALKSTNNKRGIGKTVSIQLESTNSTQDKGRPPTIAEESQSSTSQSKSGLSRVMLPKIVPQGDSSVSTMDVASSSSSNGNTKLKSKERKDKLKSQVK